MKKSFLFCAFLLILTIPTWAQEKYQLTGTVKACYNSAYEALHTRNNFRITLRSLGSGQFYNTTVKGDGSFSFHGLPAGHYVLDAYPVSLPEKDSTIIVNKNIGGFTFCIDRAYRAAPTDSIEKYRQKAISDIGSGKAKIFEWTPLSITGDPFKKLNQKVKKKYGYEYEMMNCVREQTREEIIQVKLWQAYNDVVYQHLAKLHGPQWRSNIKHERKKQQEEKQPTTRLSYASPSAAQIRCWQTYNNIL